MTRYLQTACLGIAILFASCKKDVEPTTVNEIASAPKAREVKKCEVARIITHDPHFFTQTILFEYNKKGDPVSAIPSIISTGTPQLFFRYDDKGRLTDFIGAYSIIGDGAFEFWHKYGHNTKGQVIVDTMYIFGSYGQGAASGRLVTYSQFEYDKQGRVVSHTAQSLSYPPVTVTYPYDANGNLVKSGIAYDEQVSIFRTNEVWMFMMRDYSQNNPIAAISYNSTGLPLQFNAPLFPSDPTAYMYRFRTWLLNRATIEYNCKGN